MKRSSCAQALVAKDIEQAGKDAPNVRAYIARLEEIQRNWDGGFYEKECRK